VPERDAGRSHESSALSKASASPTTRPAALVLDFITSSALLAQQQRIAMRVTEVLAQRNGPRLRPSRLCRAPQPQGGRLDASFLNDCKRPPRGCPDATFPPDISSPSHLVGTGFAPTACTAPRTRTTPGRVHRPPPFAVGYRSPIASDLPPQPSRKVSRAIVIISHRNSGQVFVAALVEMIG
jgi:hypothetical protein